MKSHGKQIRKRKVYYAYYSSPRAAPHPLIRLEGKYLEHFGFVIGDRVEIHFTENQIIIKKVFENSTHESLAN